MKKIIVLLILSPMIMISQEMTPGFVSVLQDTDVARFFGGECTKGSCVDGNGEYTYSPHGEVYIGHFDKDGYPTKGKIIYDNEDVYEGKFHYSNSTRHGYGKYTFASTGTICQGEWDDEDIENGEMIYPNGDVYKGPFDSGLAPYGIGTYVYSNGDKYEGNFGCWGCNGEFHGKGKLTYADGNIKEGFWVRGIFKGDYSGDIKDIKSICDCVDALYSVIKDAYDKNSVSNLQYEVTKISEHCDQFGGSDKDYEDCNSKKWNDALQMLESLY